MAKFTNKDLRLKDGQKVTWGTDLDANMWYDGSADQLRVDTTISGVDPTEDYHLTTKQYVDTGIATLSGSMVLDHGGLTGLGDDDHTQYVPTNGSRGFTSTVSGIDPVQSYDLATKFYIDNELATISGGIVQDHGGLTGLGDDDHTQYILVDGTRAFTNTVGGVTPVAGADLTTKDYVDLAIQGLDWQQSVSDFWSPSAGLPTTSGLPVPTRYIANDSGNGWTTNYLYEWNGTSWDETVPNDGFSAWFEDDDILYVFNGTDWVRFGSTVTHNNTNGLQGGAANEYYHLSADQYTSLTDNGGVEDASDMHIHDDRYYTEPEMDATISGIQSDISTYSDHGNLSGLGDDDHTQYILVDGTRAFTSTVDGVTPTADANLTTKLYVDGLVSTTSGTLQGEIDDINTAMGSLDHGTDLAGLLDDDHPQYILVDGSRGFTNTVSGVTPVADYDLATKAYVDAGGVDRHGRAAIADAASTLTVNFSDLGHTNYTVNATMENTSDSPPSIYPFIISGKTSSSFTVTFAGDMDSANYVMNWTVIED
jgi:hypothetical protein